VSNTLGNAMYALVAGSMLLLALLALDLMTAPKY